MNWQEKLEFVDSLTKLDPEYQQMLQTCRILENRFLAVLKTLPPEDHDLVWDYVMLCEDRSQRKLRLAIDKFMK